MGEFKRAVPATLGELKEYLLKMYENRSHVKGVKVNPSNGHLEIDLDWAANLAGYPDVYMPVKKTKQGAAKLVIERILRDVSSGHPPSDSDAQELFDLIDQQGA